MEAVFLRLAPHTPLFLYTPEIVCVSLGFKGGPERRGPKVIYYTIGVCVCVCVPWVFSFCELVVAHLKSFETKGERERERFVIYVRGIGLQHRWDARTCVWLVTPHLPSFKCPLPSVESKKDLPWPFLNSFVFIFLPWPSSPSSAFFLRMSPKARPAHTNMAWGESECEICSFSIVRDPFSCLAVVVAANLVSVPKKTEEKWEEEREREREGDDGWWRSNHARPLPLLLEMTFTNQASRPPLKKETKPNRYAHWLFPPSFSLLLESIIYSWGNSFLSLCVCSLLLTDTLTFA